MTHMDQTSGSRSLRRSGFAHDGALTPGHDVSGLDRQTLGRAMQSITIMMPVWQHRHCRNDCPVAPAQCGYPGLVPAPQFEHVVEDKGSHVDFSHATFIDAARCANSRVSGLVGFTAMRSPLSAWARSWSPARNAASIKVRSITSRCA